MPESQIFYMQPLETISNTDSYPALLPPPAQELCFSWEGFDFLTYQHLPLYGNVFPLTLLQPHSAKILEKVKSCMC